MASTSPRRLPELEGLRGLLSWWVVLCHALQQSGYSAEWLGRGARILLHGDYAVDVFIILSGFVIAKLCADSREPYGIFIARRFLRLWPAYIVCLFASLLVRPCIAAILAHPPLGDPVWGAEHAARLQQNFQFESAHYFSHIAAHLTMLHGAVPETLLPASSTAFLGPAWSISLEWQFYLVAPLLFWALKKGGSPAWVGFIVVAGFGWLARYGAPWNAYFPMESFLWQKLLLFAIGIASHRLWESLHDRGDAIAPALFGIAGVILFFTLSLPLAIWCAVLAAVLASRGVVKTLLKSAPIQFLGRVSYSTYLGHMIVLWALQPLVFALIPAVTARLMLTVLLGLGAPLILLLSVLLYRWVEAPAIALGRRLRSA